MEDDFDARSEAFMAWLKQSGAEISEKIQLADLRTQHAGRGVVALHDIAEDEPLFTIPRSAILTSANSSLAQTHPSLLSALPDPWLALTLAMLHEHLLGASSRWSPYFAILPTDFDTLMFWTDDELAELQASAVRHKIGKEAADAAFREHILPVVRQHRDVFFGAATGAPELPDAEILALAHRMGSTIMAYAFDMEPEGGSAGKEVDEEGYASEEEDEALPKGMVPLADMLNADADRNNAKLYYGTDVVEMKAIKAIKAGEEIFNDYGPLPRSDLLRRYGYVSERYAQWDVIEVPRAMVIDTARTANKLDDTAIEERAGYRLVDATLSYLDDHGILEEGYDITNWTTPDAREGFSDELIALVATLLLDDTEFARLKKKQKLPKTEKLTPEIASVLMEVVKKRAAEYPTSIVEDEGTDIGLSHEEFMQTMRNRFLRRKAMAVQVRLGEKKVLQKAEELLGEYLRSNNGTEATANKALERDGERPSKKRKVA
ncbi:Ribosomal lysine N-methyltransferase 4 [Coniosporium tulheliwenetii]|uniref:Ribosomal lysine N-methyltransferase 4 n=1 Tax=Coniosporium tulheliwenetii TaxID=3383036 RepID=A0ACC2Z6H2_9PEZI|nr:Ribosomal lysine N-methyltransferase 4 [Cladosporium sp. JES 115]